jgi:aminoglycoside phosphotransferase (APT) family kinase protein
MPLFVGDFEPSGDDATLPPMHQNQVPLSVAQVRRIVDEQFPQWRELAIRPVAGSGTVNRIFKLGDNLSARFPLVIDDPDDVLEYLQVETAAARELLGKTRFPTPEPVALGHPSAEYPGPWSVHTWLTGTPAANLDLSSSAAFARDVARFIADVRTIPVRGRSFSGYGRGGDLRLHDEWMETCFNQGASVVDVPHLRSLWRKMRDLPRTDADIMTHGDLLPSNLVVENEALVGVLDPGGLGPADPALDLIGVWSLFDDERRQLLRDKLECSDIEWARGQAWAFQQAMGSVWYYVRSNPTMSELGRRALERITKAWA